MKPSTTPTLDLLIERGVQRPSWEPDPDVAVKIRAAFARGIKAGRIAAALRADGIKKPDGIPPSDKTIRTWWQRDQEDRGNDHPSA